MSEAPAGMFGTGASYFAGAGLVSRLRDDADGLPDRSRGRLMYVTDTGVDIRGLDVGDHYFVTTLPRQSVLISQRQTSASRARGAADAQIKITTSPGRMPAGSG